MEREPRTERKERACTRWIGDGTRARKRSLTGPLEFLVFCFAAGLSSALAAECPLQVGLAGRDVTPDLPVRLAGYAGRNKPAAKIDSRLLAQALALKNASGERFVFVALDNCEVNRLFMQPVLEQLRRTENLPAGAVAVISSHTHSAPVLEQVLWDMAQLSTTEREQILKYSANLRSNLVAVVEAALADCQPAVLEQGLGRAAFAMNRRAFQGDEVVLGDNPDGPVDWDVPVLRVKGTNGAVRAILFGYACHGTSVRTGDDWYTVSGEYMAYARQHIEAHQPGAMALFLTGMGADSDPAPRGRLLDARRHGLELAGAVIGVLDRPMRAVHGSFKYAYDELDLPLAATPGRSQLETDARSPNVHVQARAKRYLGLLDAGHPLPAAVKLPVAALRLGDDLTFVLIGGEVVVDYSRRLKRALASDNVWPIGYAYEVPCYIPSARLIKEGGYETEFSLVFYGYYGPFRTSIEGQLTERIHALVGGLRAH